MDSIRLVPRVVDSAEAVALDEAYLGGKAAQLARLTAEGRRVPEFLCVTSKVFESVFRSLEADLRSTLGGVDLRDIAEARRIREFVHSKLHARGISAEDQELLLSRFDAVFPIGTKVAVRSSAVGEDSIATSYAGQLDTYLYVERSDVIRRVIDCFASAFSERALAYRQTKSIDQADVRVAVVVQGMVDATRSGIVFTANPTSCDRNEAVVSAGLGLGEGVVAGTVECDTYFVNRTAKAVRAKVVAEKRSKVVFAAGDGGTRIETVEPAEGDVPVLSETELLSIVDLASQIESDRGIPQDVEWSMDAAGVVYVLQARPITTLAEGEQTIFDNSNVVESYPGISLPLTFSFVRLAYEELFRVSSLLFGASPATLEREHDVHPSLLALLNGRIYYNISNWYRVFLQIPGLENAIPAWEKALGIEKRFSVPAARPGLFARLRSIPRKIGVALRMLRNWSQLKKRSEQFRERCLAMIADLRSRSLDEMSAHQLLRLVEDNGRDLRPRFSVTVVNDFLTQQLYELLGKLIARWRVGESINLRNELLCGEKGMESVEPVRSMLELTAAIRGDEGLLALFESPRLPEHVWEELDTDPSFETFRAMVQKHIDLYGDRTLEELKLETPLLSDHPDRLVPALRNYLRGGQNVEEMEEREREIRSRAEAAVAIALRYRPLRRTVFNFLLERVRWGVKMRENLRLLRSRAFGVVKRIYRALGRRFTQRDILNSPDDIFYLTIEEVAALVRGTSVHRNVRALIDLRKAEYAEYAKEPIAPRVVTHGIAYANSFEREIVHYENDAVLPGIGCSPGRVEAPVRVVHRPDSSLQIEGEILVAASTDPGWVFLMVAAGGLISEKGSVLSHTAIIGRELGIPTVVGVKDATVRLKDGETVVLDGESGQVVRGEATADAATSKKSAA